MIKIIDNNKPTVWVFGDSFSEDVLDLPKEDQRVKYVNEFLDGIPYKIWQEQVTDGLGYNYKNYSANNSKFHEVLGKGNSNDHMFLTVSEYSQKFKKDDIVIIGFTNTGRFQGVYPESTAQSVLISSDVYGDKTDMYHRMYMDRQDPYYAIEMFQKFKILETLSNLVGFTLYYWDWDSAIFTRYNDIDRSRFLDYQICNTLIPLNEFLSLYSYQYVNIINETNGVCDDSHFGTITNNNLFEIYFPYIQSKL